METYFNESIAFSGKPEIFPFRHKKIRDKHLIIADHGGWIVLDEKEYAAFIRSDFSDQMLFHMLEEKGMIITAGNKDIIDDSYRRRYNFLSNGVSLHILVPTLRCNQKCIYCHSSARFVKEKQYDMSPETIDKVLKFIFQTPAQAITIEFQGGDSMLNKDAFMRIVLEAKRMNELHRKRIRFALVTNLTLMDHETAEFVCNNGVDVCTSLDGPEFLHDKNRVFESGNGTYKDVTLWMKKMKEEYGKHVSALMVTTRHSLPYWKEIVDEYILWGISNVQIKYINKLGFAEGEWSEIGYTIDEFIEFWKKTADYIIELNKKGVRIMERYIELILQKILTKIDPNFLDFRSPCGIVSGQLAYDYNGDIYCCDEGRSFEMFRLGNVKDSKYSEILSSEQSQELISASMCDNYICDSCAYKPYCGVCPVISYAEQGNIVPKIPTFSKCKLFKFQFDYVFEKLLFDAEIRKIFFNWVTGWRNCEKNAEMPNDIR